MFSDTADWFLRAIGGRHGHRGSRGFAASFGHAGRSSGGDDVPGGRKLSAQELQLVLLLLLAERPAHGYELIRLLEERSDGFYVPSPGMIYPILTYLDEIGHASVTPEGNRKLYVLTEAGRAHLAANRSQAEAILRALTRIGGRMEDVREAFSGLHDADPQAADELHDARHDLKHALRRKRGCGPAETRRLVQILRRATAEILKQES